MRKILICLLATFILKEGNAQYSRYIIRFADKNNSPYSFTNPLAYLSQKAIDRRNRYGISLDSTDLPVNPAYINSLLNAGNLTILNISKWLNAVTIQTTDQSALTHINNLDFVVSAHAIAPKRMERSYGGSWNEFNQISSKSKNKKTTTGFYNYGSSAIQVEMHNGNFLHRIGLRGEGILIGVVDAGFLNYMVVNSLDSIRSDGRIIDTWDFVERSNSVNEDDSHGMQVLSVMAANLPGEFIGTSPKASYLLYRSEDVFSEYPIEEHNWVCAAERVDSIGGDMINSSLGYNMFDDPVYNYSFSDMDGNTAMSTIGADLAAAKGILVVNSAGNEGGNSWGRITAPADADSILTVGAVTASGNAAGFTSRGPSADGRIKPEVVSLGVGTTVQLPNNTIDENNGTSFAAPNIAGLAASLWQGFRELNNMKIIDALKRSSHRYANPGDTTGYGIPDVKKALVDLTLEYANASSSIQNCRANINWNSKDMKAMYYQVERKLSGQPAFIKIGEKHGIAETFSPGNHSFSDTLINMAPMVIQYRIRQVFDTTASGFTAAYIDTISVVLNNNCIATSLPPLVNEENNISISPNPARTTAVVKVKTQNAINDLEIVISNISGQVVKRINTNKGPGETSFEISLVNLAAGTYYISVFEGQKRIGVKEMVKW